MKAFHADLSTRLDALRAQGRLRHLIPVRPLPASGIEAEGRSFLNLAGNDYLGLATSPALCTAFYRELEGDDMLSRYGLGSGASRLMTGNHLACAQLEEELAHYYQRQAALLFNSGYHLNTGLLPALSTRDDLILADKLCHASLIDGMRLSRARVLRYPHLDYTAIDRILERERRRVHHVFLVSESIFSMDGDCANLIELVRLKEKWGALLYLDEAHGVGIRGELGRGLAEEQGVLAAVDFFIGTFGKAYGGLGAFVVAERLVVDYLINHARTQIFSTGLAPINVQWLRFALRQVPQMRAERAQVAALADQFRAALRTEGLVTGGESNIVPVFIGDAARTLVVAQRVRERGYWVGAVRPPTVPQGSSRLRLSLNATMHWETLAPVPRLIARALAEAPK